ncbi:MAG: Smr/MutS family protein [Cytophagales bacterium]|nr:Smr/MutS family protein [Cytophagales bacterium]
MNTFAVGDNVSLMRSTDKGVVMKILTGNKYLVKLRQEIEVVIDAKDLVKSYDFMPATVVKKDKKIIKTPQKYVPGSIDLHVSEHKKNTYYMETSGIASQQISDLKTYLNLARSQHLKEVIVIHGVGEGILKQMVIDVLKDTYFVKKYTQADVYKYGQGAMKVHLE